MSALSLVVFIIVFGVGRIILHLRYYKHDIKKLTKKVEIKAHEGKI